MKRILSMVLAVTMFVTMFAVTATVQADEKGFVIDGNLDIWYITDLDQYADDDNNTYDFYELDPYGKDPDNGNGVNFYDSPETSAAVYLAYDDTYVYVYVKVWDDQILSYDLVEEIGSGYDVTMALNASFCDSIEIWFDPDPNSQTHFADGSERPAKGSGLDGAIVDGFYANTPDPEQGDIQMRYLAEETKLKTRFEDYYNTVKPGYDGVYFGTYVNDTENVCPFTFDNEPRENIYTGEIVSSGYGLEARFPRNDDDSGAFAINVAVNNAANSFETAYALAMGNAWWMDYAQAPVVFYNYDTNPFFNQSEEVLASKSVQYTNSVGNAAGAAVVKTIKGLPATVSEANRATVQAAADAYLDLTDTQKGYVQANNYDKLATACATLGISLADPDEPTNNLEKVKALIAGLPENPTLEDRATLDEIEALLWELTEAEWEELTEEEYNKFWEVAAAVYALEITTYMGDINMDGSANAGDALMVLKYAVGKEEFNDDQMFYADVNVDAKIDAGDALDILKYAVDKLDKFEAVDFYLGIGE